jgi:DNA-binding MarR family transcriptional regulator
MPIEEWASLYTAYAIMHKECDRALSPRGITVPQASVIGLLGRYGRPLPVSTIARLLTQESQSATSLVDRMCAAGLVERVDDPRDRRVVLVRLTREGERMFNVLRTTAPAFSDEMFSVLSPEERLALKDLLDKFVQRNTQRLR